MNDLKLKSQREVEALEADIERLEGELSNAKRVRSKQRSNKCDAVMSYACATQAAAARNQDVEITAGKAVAGIDELQEQLEEERELVKLALAIYTFCSFCLMLWLCVLRRLQSKRRKLKSLKNSFAACRAV